MEVDKARVLTHSKHSITGQRRLRKLLIFSLRFVYNWGKMNRRNINAKYLIGIDEVGRGPVAGPVAVGAVAYEIAFEGKLKKEIAGVRDSKKVPMRKREAILAMMKQKKKDGVLDFSVAFVGAGIIDRKGIAYAIRRAIRAALMRFPIDPAECLVVLDGGLRAPKEYYFQQTIIHGDDIEFAISLASIIAKVTRDKKMAALGGRFPAYKFEEHKGYGTREHMRRIKRYGMTDLHRRSFLKSLATPKGRRRDLRQKL